MRILGQRGGTEATRAFGAAGWLLAELTLILMVVFMGSLPGDVPSVATDGATTPSPSSTSTTPGADPDPGSGGDRGPRRVGLNINVKSFDEGVVMRGRGDRRAARQLVQWIGKHGSRPGLVLLYGVSYSSADPVGGTEVAEDMAAQLVRLGFNARYRDVLVRPFLKVYSGAATPLGQVTADVYYYQRER